ncbi:urea carboxylase [Xenorhabdus szentirmaii]|uniref:Biotin carboxylase n=1 Tax=Xenorhabdus szentirmaii DSM 16338 TaxID=1427518 RepID=W1IV99_9GAMM|nr:urea carboxylase [Xenorhabdus szentirmaii]PHM34930.1 putative multifunctional urea amidolyase [Xenorhabdus szentirmaii DSM 16338]PHM43687.1 putative multifunctional urea amidolyase [Xenorhabdus szentirmaii]CDL82374.1 Urea carboxylase [Xenorhabdus szentirmaii DSM 16338]
MFKTVLIANRGEIACRAIRTFKRLGIHSIVVYSDADKNARHVKEADMALPLNGGKACDSYLCIDKIIAAAQQSGAEAIWPGYGFLSESVPFAEACEKAGIVFIGPTSQHINEFGLKHRARKLAADAGVPMTPGTGLLNSLDEALRAANDIGYPVMLKSTAGGGGIGLSCCHDPDTLRQAWESVRHLGEQFFSDAGVFLERCIERARHIEVQILGDGKGQVVALGERDCSLQRRNQKVVEEAPAPGLPAKIRQAMLTSAVQLGKRVNYRSAGTVEYIYDEEQDAFYFLEVNTRLQVEHPVTECVTGLDLVECMLRVAAGLPIDWEQLNRASIGTAIEVRLYAENPQKNFQPSSGILTEVAFPDGVRIDSGVNTGSEVSAFYDPMIAKMIVYGENRDETLIKLRNALNASRLHGIMTNLEYLRQITASEAFQKGKVWTRMLDSFTPHANAIEVLQAGMCSSIQDYPGRQGYWDIGVPPSGPLDDFAFRLANRIVGNHESAAGLELTLEGPTLLFHCDAVIALTGADCPARLDEKPVPYWQPLSIKAGQTLAIGRAQSGCRTYLAVRNGFDVPCYLGSRSTFVLGQFGGHAGRTLRIADMLPISQPSLPACTTPPPISEPQSPEPSLPSFYYGNSCSGGTWHIGVVYGPHGAPDFFTPDYIDEFFNCEWQVHYNSNRLGVRLIGPKPSWTRPDGGEAGLHPSNIHDCEYAIGSINFTGDSPVILTRDGPSLGGFVCPVTIAKAELWKVGQVKAGDRILFHPISIEEALALEEHQNRCISTLQLNSPPTFNPPSLAPEDRTSATVLAELDMTDSRPAVVYRQAGDNYILIEYGDNVLNLGLRLRVHLLMEKLEALSHSGIQESAPGVRSLQIRYDSRQIQQQELVSILLSLEEQIGDISKMKVPSRVIHLPMAFEDSATLNAVSRYQDTVRASAPWLPNNVDFIQRINGLPNREAVRQIIFDASYLILGLGDVYLGAPCAVPIDPRHRLLSSKYNPARTFTAEGTVGIGGMYMCIYGMDSPGGYQLVGRTLPIWNKFLKNRQFAAGKPWLLRFFDQIRFYPVTEQELDQLRGDFQEGRTAIQIEETQFDFAEHQRFLQGHAKEIRDFQQRQTIAFETEVERWQHEGQGQPLNTEEPLQLPDIDENAVPVNADICGNIWKILVTIGEEVVEGQPLLIVEAMKMELAIHAPQSGKISRIHCKSGHLISPGDTLLWLE